MGDFTFILDAVPHILWFTYRLLAQLSLFKKHSPNPPFRIEKPFSCKEWVGTSYYSQEQLSCCCLAEILLKCLKTRKTNHLLNACNKFLVQCNHVQCKIHQFYSFQEEQNKGKPNWEHLNEELHVLITVEDTRNRAELKLIKAVEEVKKLLVPSVSFKNSQWIDFFTVFKES